MSYDLGSTQCRSHLSCGLRADPFWFTDGEQCPIYAPTVLWSLAARQKKACLVVDRYLNPAPKGAECSVELLEPRRMVQAKEPINRFAFPV